MEKKCFVAVSGGVDSAVALYLLKTKGFSVEGITMAQFDSELVPDFSPKEAAAAKSLCEKMGVNHHLVDLKDVFREKVIGDFLNAYEAGETPNPCVVCNRYLKFGALADYAFERGAEEYATGHYVRVVSQGDRRVITQAKDINKDQSYVLWSLTAEQISRFNAPLGEFSKPEVREIAENIGLEVAHKSDSQDICFIPDGDYRSFLERISPQKDKKGIFVHKNGAILGEHSGQRYYTIGQRKGLGIAYTEPLYVIGRDMAENKIILGSNEDLFLDRFVIRETNFSACDRPESGMNCQVRVRYRAPFVDCRVTPLDESRMLVETAKPVRAVTPGQSAVFYHGETLLGGGIIC